MERLIVCHITVLAYMYSMGSFILKDLTPWKFCSIRVNPLNVDKYCMYCTGIYHVWTLFFHFGLRRDAETLSQHFSPKLHLEARAQSGNIIYNLCLLMRRQSVSVCCVSVRLSSCVCVVSDVCQGWWVFMHVKAFPVFTETSKSDTFNHQIHCVIKNKSSE